MKTAKSRGVRKVKSTPRAVARRKKRKRQTMAKVGAHSTQDHKNPPKPDKPDVEQPPAPAPPLSPPPLDAPLDAPGADGQTTRNP